MDARAAQHPPHPALRVAVVAHAAEGARRLRDMLVRAGLDPFAVAPEEARDALHARAADAVVVEFSGATRATLEALLGDRRLTERLATLAVFPPDQLPAYESGTAADDFLLWPVLPEEAAARVRLAVRRRRGADGEHVLRFGDLTIDIANYRVAVAGRPVELTFKEYELLKFLAANRDKVFTREALLNRVWGYDYYGGARTVDVHIRRLRAKIEDGHRTFIETIRNVGYRFREGP
jgi:two-component system alkaline phosphatase synthesis response regulator PhoP